MATAKHAEGYLIAGYPVSNLATIQKLYYSTGMGIANNAPRG
jgi:hypothetical protein